MPGTSSQFAHSTVFLTYIPQSPLATYVDTLWLYENYKPSHMLERRLPDGSMELVINLRENESRFSTFFMAKQSNKEKKP